MYFWQTNHCTLRRFPTFPDRLLWFYVILINSDKIPPIMCWVVSYGCCSKSPSQQFLVFFWHVLILFSQILISVKKLGEPSNFCPMWYQYLIIFSPWIYPNGWRQRPDLHLLQWNEGIQSWGKTDGATGCTGKRS